MADGIFGNIYDVRRQQRQDLEESAMDFASLSRGRGQVAAAGMAGGQLARGIGGMLGMQTPEELRVAKLQEIQQKHANLDLSQPENMKIVAGDLLREGFSEEAKLAYEMIDDMTTSITTASQKFDLDAQASMLQKLFITEHGSLDTVENLKKFKKQLDQAGLGNTTLYGRVSADLRTLRGEEEKISKETRTSLKDLSEQMTKYNIPTMEKNLIVMENLIKEFPDNLPGINILEQYDPREPAKRVQSAYAKLRNIVLKERSGAAVTVPEFERLKEEIRGATFVTDKDIIRWVGTIRDAVEANKKGILAGYTQDVKDLYFKGGGVSTTTNVISPELQAIINKYK